MTAPSYNRRPARRGTLGALAVAFWATGCGPAGPPPPAPKATTAESPEREVRQFCGVCHPYPPPDTFPRWAWSQEVVQAYRFYEAAPADRFAGVKVPPPAGVIAHYEARAPAELPLPAADDSAVPAPVRFSRTDGSLPGQGPCPAVANVNLVHLSDPRRLDLVACDMRSGVVAALKPYEADPQWRTLANLGHPAHAEAVDLDGDGIMDLLVADLGSFYPTDDRRGRVVWLRGRADGSFLPIPLLEGVGRVADVQAAPFRGGGRFDLVVAVFGWQNTGEILYLENRTTDWSRPVFVPRVVDSRHGAIHVPVADLNGDGRPDFVAVISQEHETVVAFLNEGGGRFRPETLFTAPHPAFGCTGIQLVDLDGDGRLDVLLTNGDVLDPPYLLKPYHGVHWLQNLGTFPFTHHALTALCGVHRAVAADFQGRGRLDVVAVSFLPAEEFPTRADRRLDAVVYLEQTGPGRFVRHALEAGTCDHATCAAGAWDGDGVAHLVTGNFCLSERHRIDRGVTLWKNLGLRKGTP